MSTLINQAQFAQAQVIDFVTHERSKALSRREWMHRLAGYGYRIRETDAGDVVETLPHHVEVCVLPAAETA